MSTSFGSSYEVGTSSLYMVDSFLGGNGSTSLGARVGHWNGQKNDNTAPRTGGWKSLGSSISGGSSRVRAVHVVSETEVYVCGSFTSIDSVSANNVACWTGSGFVSVGSSINGECQQVVYDPVGDCIYVSSYSGTQRFYKGTLSRTAGVVSGGSWSSNLTGGPNQINALETDRNGNIYAAGVSAGSGALMKYTGSTWMGVSSPPSNTVYGLFYSVSLGTLFIVGTFSQKMTKYDPNTNTVSTFTPTLPAEVATPYAVCTDSSNNIYIGGGVSGSNHTYQCCKATYSSGTWGSWSPMYANASVSGLLCLKVDSNGNLYGRGNSGGFRIYDNSTSTWYTDTDNVGSGFTIGSAINPPLGGGGGGDPHMCTIYQQKYFVPHDWKIFKFFYARDRDTTIQIDALAGKIDREEFKGRLMPTSEGDYREFDEVFDKNLLENTFIKNILIRITRKDGTYSWLVDCFNHTYRLIGVAPGEKKDLMWIVERPPKYGVTYNPVRETTRESFAKILGGSIFVLIRTDSKACDCNQVIVYVQRARDFYGYGGACVAENSENLIQRM
jgi:hypothetical protein